MMNVKSFVKRAKDQGIQMLVFQSYPSRRLYFTGNDKEVPEAIGSALAWAAIQLGKLSKIDPKEVLQSLQVHAVGTAMKIIEEEERKAKNQDADFRNMVQGMTDSEEDEDDDDEDGDVSHDIQ